MPNLTQQGFLDVQKESAWALSNLTSGGTQSQIEALVAAGGVEALVTVLGVFETSVVTVALEGLDNILAVSIGEGVHAEGVRLQWRRIHSREEMGRVAVRL